MSSCSLSPIHDHDANKTLSAFGDSELHETECHDIDGSSLNFTIPAFRDDSVPRNVNETLSAFEESDDSKNLSETVSDLGDTPMEVSVN